MSTDVSNFILNLDQQTALTAMLDFLQGTGSFFVLKGYAGTGKTTLVQLLIQRCQLRIVLTASTHKAAQALMRSAYQWGNHHLEAMTIHRLLGLVVRQYQGEKYLSAEGTNRLENYDLVLVDECSMVNEELWTILQDQAQASSVKFILIGDPAQLPPVGELESITFSLSPSAELTQVMRQAGGNPIGPLLDSIRTQLDQPLPSPRETDLILDNQQGFTSIAKREQFLQFALKAFSSLRFQDDSNYARILAWRNKEVAQLNTYVRRQLFGSEAPRFLAGERLMARETIVDPISGKILLNSCGEVRIQSAFEDEAHGYRAWILEVLTEEDIQLKVPILHEAAFSVFEETKQLALNLAFEANQEAQSGERDAKIAQIKAWEQVERYNNLFAALDYCYALTVHKAQGSQFNNVFVIDRDLQRNPNVRERNQLRYVAYSRAMDRLFVLR